MNQSRRHIGLAALIVLLGVPPESADAQQQACATSVITVQIDPLDHNVLYAGTFYDGLLRSTDAGRSWTPLVEPRVESVSALLFDPTDARWIYGATYEQYLFKSEDGGETWQRRSRGLVQPPCRPFPCLNIPEFSALAADPGAPSTIYAVSGSLYRSRDGGMNWDKVNFSPTDEEWSASAILVVSPPESTIYLAADALPDQYAIFRSTDHGVTWAMTSQAPPTQVFSLTVDPSDPAALYAGTTLGVSKSTDRGEHWRPSNEGFPIRQPYQFPVIDLAVDQGNPGTLYASSDPYGLFKSTDHGEGWSSLKQGLEGLIVHSTTIDPTDSSVVYAASNGVYRSADGGVSWQRAFDLGKTPIILGTEPAGSYVTSDGSTGFLTIIGKGFDDGSAVSWNGSPRPTSLSSCTRLWVTLSFEDTAPGVAWITVTNPDGARSDPFPLVIKSALPDRTVTAGRAAHGVRQLQPRR